MRYWLTITLAVSTPLAATFAEPVEPTPTVTGGLMALHAPEAQAGPCIQPSERAAALHAADAASMLLGLDAAGSSLGADTRFPFYPQAGNLYSDIFHNNYVDLDPSSGILDWACEDHTYNGHLGHDSDLRTFSEQRIGVPVFAALPGVVVGVADGNFDERTSLTPAPANYVILDHSALDPGLRTLYWHLKNGSIAVALGESVEPGQQLGLTASSGFSSGPHLHFETQRNGLVFETMSGLCSPTNSSWATQWSKRREHYLRDFGFVRGVISGSYAPPTPFPRSRFTTNADSSISYWIQGHNLPRGSNWRMRFIRPSGALEFDTGARSFGFSTADFRSYWAWFNWNVPAMRSVFGEWTVEIDINAETAVVAKVTTAPSSTTPPNRPPYAVSGAFDPSEPADDDVIFFRLDADLVHDDPEYDVVSYRYQWFLDGAPIRDIVSAAHADAIPPLATFGGGAELVVRVTPSDADANGATTETTLSLGPTPCTAADFAEPYGIVDIADVVTFLQRFGAADPSADLAAPQGTIDIADVVAFLQLFGAGCA